METTLTTSKLTDEELVRNIVKDNNTLLFGVLYDRYATRIYNKCYGFSKSQKEAEDLTQDVFLQLFVKLASFKERSKFSSWVYSFTYNFCVNYVNRNRERKISDASDSITENEAGVQMSDDNSLYEMKAEKLKQALTLIDPEEKKLLLLKYQDDISIKELTELLEISESAVKMRLKRAKARILEIYKNLD
ncbi:RNA polymerase sigma factor [Aurantibacter crassamenti]|uniref:RNA polymerase sigma factor n=1 Tax=Aurantibacter crassamenti TaxID=1837375 RepID=UPI00193A8E8B|nr:RNA polymerase sigma factor [Aurantibacter crassamenti]MBM1104616.1 RNA polymerase sigma factor [Aurantibacter crassamenti]